MFLNTPGPRRFGQYQAMGEGSLAQTAADEEKMQKLTNSKLFKTFSYNLSKSRLPANCTPFQ